MLHGYLIITTTDLYGHSVILQPSVRLRLTGELANSRCQTEIGRNLSGSDSSAETLRSGDMNSAASRAVTDEFFPVCSVPLDQTLNEDRPRIKSWLSWVDWDPPLIAVRDPLIILPACE